MSNIAIICDSHGTNYGCKSYTTIIKEHSDYTVDIKDFPGISSTKILGLLHIDVNYDFIILQIGNPDVHPRMPKKVMSKLKKIVPTLARDSLFSIPPKISLSFFLRYPFFILRRIIIRNMKNKEYYTSDDKLKENFDTIIKLCISKTENLIILPLFEVSSDIYGNSHNNRAKVINQWLAEKYNECYFDDKLFTRENFCKFYNKDYFHFQNEFHRKLAECIINKMQDK